MKKKYISLLFISLFLTSCNNYKTENISFDKYTDIVKNMQEDDKCIFLFSQDSCGHCKTLRPILNKYIKNDKEDNIPIYRVDITVNNGQYKDETIGTYKDKDNDKLYSLDRRISLYKAECNISDDDLLDLYSPNAYFSYVCTPLFIFYKGGKEVFISSNFEALVDENGKVDYDEFKEYMKFKNTYPYSQEFNI